MFIVSARREVMRGLRPSLQTETVFCRKRGKRLDEVVFSLIYHLVSSLISWRFCLATFAVFANLYYVKCSCI